MNVVAVEVSYRSITIQTKVSPRRGPGHGRNSLTAAGDANKLSSLSQAVACGRGAEAEAPSRAATPHSHQLQRTTREEDAWVNGTHYHATRCSLSCGVSFQSVLTRLTDMASTLERSHVAAVDIELTDFFSSSDEGAAKTILTAMISRVQSYEKLLKKFSRTFGSS